MIERTPRTGGWKGEKNTHFTEKSKELENTFCRVYYLEKKNIFFPLFSGFFRRWLDQCQKLLVRSAVEHIYMISSFIVSFGEGFMDSFLPRRCASETEHFITTGRCCLSHQQRLRFSFFPVFHGIEHMIYDQVETIVRFRLVPLLFFFPNRFSCVTR